MDYQGNDLKLEYIEITKNGQETRYTPNNEVGKPILEKAQKQFDDYLQQIKTYKLNEGLVNLE